MRINSAVRLSIAALICMAAVVVAAQQPRDRAGAVVAAGTAGISGQVVTDEASPRAIGRAIVTLGGDAVNGRSVITDDTGRFAFGNLPAGRFTVAATKGAYLPAAYGARRPGRPGTAIVLAEGAQQAVTLRMARGAVVSGTIRDGNGNPLGGLEVVAINIRTSVRGGGSGTGEPVTDDRGMYRIYGLPPGDYQVRAMTSPSQLGGLGPIGSRSVQEMDSVLAMLTRRATAPRAGLATTAAPAPLPLAPAVGFLPIYFPGTPIQANAETITLAAGEERAGLDFELRPAQAGAIVGTVTGPIANPGAVQMSIYATSGLTPTSGSGTNPILSEAPSAQSNGFKYTNVTPARYRIIARADRNQTAPPDFLYAVADVETLGNDVAGVSLQLQPGSTFAGRLSFDATTIPIPRDLSTIRIGLSTPGGSSYSMTGGTIVGNTFAAGATTQAEPDGSFVIRNIAPGSYTFNVYLPADISANWILRTAVAGERELLDVPVDVVPGTNVNGAQVTLSDRHSELAGTLQTAGGVPAPDYFMVVFPTDKTLWRAGARRIKSTRPGNDGRFSFRDLPGGRYFLAALTDVEPADLADVKFLEQIVPAALQVTLEHGEIKTQDVTIR
jgi:uncharacterized protein (DUF2141 family)